MFFHYFGLRHRAAGKFFINSIENIKRVLDTGVWGVVVPMVNSREEAEAVVNAARYAPIGKRSIRQQVHAADFETDPSTYYARANEEILVVVMAEHVDALADAEKILSVPGIDVVFIGPNDLHNSLGLTSFADSDHKEYIAGGGSHLESGATKGCRSGHPRVRRGGGQAAIGARVSIHRVASEAGFMLSKAQETTAALGMKAAGPVARY